MNRWFGNRGRVWTDKNRSTRRKSWSTVEWVARRWRDTCPPVAAGPTGRWARRSESPSRLKLTSSTLQGQFLLMVTFHSGFRFIMAPVWDCTISISCRKHWQSPAHHVRRGGLSSHMLHLEEHMWKWNLPRISIKKERCTYEINQRSRLPLPCTNLS